MNETAETLGLPQKPELARLLVLHADRRGWVDWTPEQFAAATGYDVHDVCHAFWDFQKKGQMKFREEHIGTDRRLVALRLTASGRQAMIKIATPAPVAVTDPEPKQNGNGVDREALEQTIKAVRRAEEQMVRDTIQAEIDAVAVAYPLIEGLIDRRDKLVDAASLLEAAGQPDLALKALEAADGEVYTPLEAEAVRLYRATVGKDIEKGR